MTEVKKMTNEEAKEILLDMANELQLFPESKQGQAFDMAIKALEQEQKPKTIQEIQAESEKYQKAFEDGYEQGYAQARFDYEQETYNDAISRQAVLNQIFYSTDNSGDVVLGSVLRRRIENLPSVKPQTPLNVNELFNKIRAEISAMDLEGRVDAYTLFIRTPEQVKQMALNIIDKYKKESEEV